MVLADGRRAFVKAAGRVLNPRTPDIHRQEVAVMRTLPAAVPAPRLLGAYDDGDWVALALTDVDGRHPDAPWDPAELDRVLAAMTDLSLSLTPSPITDVGTVWSTQTAELTAWPRHRGRAAGRPRPLGRTPPRTPRRRRERAPRRPSPATRSCTSTSGPTTCCSPTTP